MRTLRSPLTFLGPLLLLILSSAPASAQSLIARTKGGPIDIQLFRPAIDSKGLITLNASQVLRHLDVSFGLVVNWSLNPLALSGAPIGGGLWKDPETGESLDSRYNIANLVTGNLQFAIGLFKHFEVGLGLPVSLWNGDTSPNPERDKEGKIEAQGVGDMRLHLKGRILNTSRHPVGLGVVTTISLPTGDDEKFLGTGRVGIAPSLVVDKEFFNGRFHLALNVGARILTGSKSWTDDQGTCETADRSYANCSLGRTIDSGSLLTYGIGGSIAIVPQRLAFITEIYGQTGFSAMFDSEALNSAHEVVAGLKVYLARNSYFTIGASRGLRGGGTNYQYGSPDVRLFLAFIFEPSIGDRDGDGIKDDVDQCPDDPEDFDDFEDEDGCPDIDNDKDGILDVDDQCPNEPEDLDGFEDEDGCPDLDVLDRDGDGIPDDVDKCPDDPEDFDGFEDEDGCPDPDNDKDGILDVDDLCPNDPEDKDGFEDEDGCPDPDNDKDRILDVDDKCPNEPETYNGYEDEDGCPDKGRVVVHKGRIEILDKIYFETDKAVIKPISYPILNAIAATLQGNPQILLIEIQGHADERGSDTYNMRLTDDRAHSVKTYLTDKGVDGGRLKAKGYGETRPVDRASNEAAWSKNRRVEFVILKRLE